MVFIAEFKSSHSLKFKINYNLQTVIINGSSIKAKHNLCELFNNKFT